MKIANFYLTIDPASAYRSHLVMAISASLVNSILDLRGSLLQVLDSMVVQDDESGIIHVEEMDEVVMEAGFAEGVIQAFVERSISSVASATFEVRYQYVEARAQEFMAELVDGLAQIFSIITEKTNAISNTSAFITALVQLKNVSSPQNMSAVSKSFAILATDSSLMECAMHLAPYSDIEARMALSEVVRSMCSARQEFEKTIGDPHPSHDMKDVAGEIKKVLDTLLLKEMDKLPNMDGCDRPKTFLGWFPVEDGTHLSQTAHILAATPTTIKKALSKDKRTDLITLSQGQHLFSHPQSECIELEIYANIEGCPESGFNTDPLEPHKNFFETGAKITFSNFH